MATNPRPTGMTEEFAKSILQELYREISITSVSIHIQVGDREGKSMKMALKTNAEPAPANSTKPRGTPSPSKPKGRPPSKSSTGAAWTPPPVQTEASATSAAARGRAVIGMASPSKGVRWRERPALCSRIYPSRAPPAQSSNPRIPGACDAPAAEPGRKPAPPALGLRHAPVFEDWLRRMGLLDTAGRAAGGEGARRLGETGVALKKPRAGPTVAGGAGPVAPR